MLESVGSSLNRTRIRATARLRWWLAQQLLTIDCADVGGRSPETAIPLRQAAQQPEKYDLMLRYARCCFGRNWRLGRTENERRGDRRYECLVVISADEREHCIWFDVTPESN